MLYQLENDKDLDKIKNPEYIIFTFIDDHLNRINTFSFLPFNDTLYLKYEVSNGKAKEVYPILPLLYNLYFVRCIDRDFGKIDYNNISEVNNSLEKAKVMFEKA